MVEVFSGARALSYLEIGSNDPLSHSNTALLESAYGWTGLSIEIDGNFVDRFNSVRSNPCLELDAVEIDYASLLPNYFDSRTIDYLSIDVEPASVSLEALKRILASGFQFRCITFEHERYKEGDACKVLAHQLLSGRGYARVKENVALAGWGEIEDWYLSTRHLELISQTRGSKL